MRVRRLILPLLFALTSGCSQLLTDSYSYAEVGVLVTEAGGEPLDDVELVLYTGSRHMGYGATTMDGRYTFGFVPAGSYGVGLSPPEGYRLAGGAPSFKTFKIEEGEVRELFFELEPEPLTPGP